MSTDWEQVAKSYWDRQPHPKAPSLTIGEFATAVKLASMAKFGGHASAHEAALFWPEFKASGMSPQQFEHALDRIAPISFVYHGRPPTMSEIGQLQDKPPGEVRRYFGDLPHRLHPDISAENMVKAYQRARPWAREHLGREPVLTEAAYLHHSGESPDSYYSRISAQNTPQQDGVQATVGGNPGGRGTGTTGGPPTHQ